MKKIFLFIFLVVLIIPVINLMEHIRSRIIDHPQIVHKVIIGQLLAIQIHTPGKLALNLIELTIRTEV